MLAGDSATYLFGVIPVVHGSYSSPIIPAMLSTLLLKYVEKLVDRITPEWSKSFLKPLLIVMIVTPITLCAIAPLGLIIGNGLQFVINGIYGFAPWLAMMLFAGFMPFIVMTGMHWAFVPASMLGISGGCICTACRGNRTGNVWSYSEVEKAYGCSVYFRWNRWIDRRNFTGKILCICDSVHDIFGTVHFSGWREKLFICGNHFCSDTRTFFCPLLYSHKG